ncbi:MAG: hypothetical protein ACRERR_13575 [Moraxellaceae bacterium]
MAAPMNSNRGYQEIMLQAVADALGPELLAQVAFVGGCTTALLITDAFTLESVRFTDDVDVIVHVLGPGRWQVLLAELRARGFRESPEDDITCRMRLAQDGGRELIVDFMPDDEKILGFTNRWYADAVMAAKDFSLPSGTVIRVVSPVHFVATKLEAWRGRGNNDPLGSRDMEDLLSVVDGRETLLQEIAAATPALQQYIAEQFTETLQHPDFDYAVQATARSSQGREAIIFQRWQAIASLAPDNAP